MNPETGAGRFRRGDARTRQAGRRGGQTSTESRRRKRALKAGVVLDALAQESFHTFFTQRLGYGAPSWAAAHVVARVIDGTPLAYWSEQERILYGQISGGRRSLPTSLRELHLILGRGSGKSTIEAALVCYAASRRYPGLGRGERPRAWLLAGDQEQATVLRDYVLGMLEGDEALNSLMLHPTRQDKITLMHGVVIQIRAAHWKKVRGPTLALVAADELAFWWSDELAANPDAEVLRAVRPGLLKLPGGGLLVCATTPYAQQGAAWSAYEQHYGKEHPRTLVLHAPTLTFRPTMDRDVIAAAVADDPLAASEWNAEWRSDVATFLNPQAVDAVTDRGVFEREPEPGIAYTAFVDVSGGASRGDSWAMAISHAEHGVAVLDLVREVRPDGHTPLNPQAVIEQWMPTLEDYGVTTLVGDRYGGEITKQLWAEAGFDYEVTPLTKADLYREALPAINAAKVRLLDHPTMRGQLLRLVRKPRQGGRDVIDHPPGGHDDVANCVCAVIALSLGVGAPKRAKPRRRVLIAR